MLQGSIKNNTKRQEENRIGENRIGENLGHFPDKLCRNHLLGEHREIHAIWAVITEKKKGYSMHPETIR